MSRRHLSFSHWQLLAIAAALLVCVGGSQSIFAQGGPLPSSIPSTRSKNPNANLNHAGRGRSGERTKETEAKISKPSPETEKQQEFEQAINDGNTARDANNYTQAITSYQKAELLNPKDERSYYGLGNVYSDLSCADSAIEAYLKSLRLNKDFREAFLALGYAYSTKERYDDARAQFNAVLKKTPRDAEARIGLVSVDSKQGKYEEALDQLTPIINDESIEAKERALALTTRGTIYGKQRRYEAAIADFEKSIELNPERPVTYLFLGSAELSLAFSKLPGVQSADELSPQERAALAASAKLAGAHIAKAKEDREHPYSHPIVSELLTLALAYQFRYQEATAEINNYFSQVKALESQISTQTMKCGVGFDQLKAEGHWYVADIYFLEGYFEAESGRRAELFKKAMEEFEQVIKLRQDFSSAYLMQALIYGHQKKYEESIAQYKKAIVFQAEADRAGSYHSMALAQNTLGRNDEAIDNVQEAIRLNPNNPTSYEILATIYVSQGKLEETFAQLEKASVMRTKLGLEAGTAPGPYYYLGITYAIRFMKDRNEKDFAEAIRLLKKAVALRPKAALYYESLGVVYEKHSEADEALANYQKAAEYDPRNPEPYLHMADVYADLKHNDDAAIERLKKALELKPDPQTYWRLAQVYSRKKDETEAIKLLLKALELDANYLPAHLDLAFLFRESKNYPEAIKHANKAIALAPTDSQPYKEMAKIFEAQQNSAEAIRYYEEAIKRLKANDSNLKNLYLGRIARLGGRYAESIDYFKKLNFPGGPAQMYYDSGVTYVVSRNKQAALEQHQQLTLLKSDLAADLLKRIKEMK